MIWKEVTLGSDISDTLMKRQIRGQSMKKHVVRVSVMVGGRNTHFRCAWN